MFTRSLALAALMGSVVAGCAALGGPRKHARKPTPPSGEATLVGRDDRPPQTPFVAAEPSAASASSGGESTLPAAVETTMVTPSAEEPPAPFTSGLPSGGSPALAYAALSSTTCLAELKKRAVSFTKVDSAPGVDTPIRLTGPLRGVDFHGQEPKSKQASTLYEILDCRLALALDDFARILAPHDVVEAVHMSIYRPAAKVPTDAKRHEAALAIDLAYLVKKDGSKLVVLDHWHGYIGAKTCGAGSGPAPASKEALELRKILCDAGDAKLFNVVLTPNYNKPHQNHFHLEVTRGVKWFIVN